MPRQSRRVRKSEIGRNKGVGVNFPPIFLLRRNYSPVDRLTVASGPYGTRTYSYDGVGNRVAQDENGSGSQYTYGATSNRLYQITGTDAASLDYDTAGNTRTKNDLAFTHNAANRLSTVTTPGAAGPQTTAFGYSALGERVLKSARRASPTSTTTLPAT